MTESRPSEPTSKRPYEPPQIVSEDAFETTALACGKINAAQGMKCVGAGAKVS